MLAIEKLMNYAEENKLSEIPIEAMVTAAKSDLDDLVTEGLLREEHAQELIELIINDDVDGFNRLLLKLLLEIAITLKRS